MSGSTRYLDTPFLLSLHPTVGVNCYCIMDSTEALEISVLSLLPRLRNSDNLEEIAYVLGVDVPEGMQGNVRRLSRLIIQFLNSDDFDVLVNGEELLERVARMLKRFLGVGINDQDENGQRSGGGDDGHGAGGGREIDETAVEENMAVGGSDLLGLEQPLDAQTGTGGFNVAPPPLTRAGAPGFLAEFGPSSVRSVAPPTQAEMGTPRRGFNSRVPATEPNWFGGLHMPAASGSRMLAPRIPVCTSTRFRAPNTFPVTTTRTRTAVKENDPLSNSFPRFSLSTPARHQQFNNPLSPYQSNRNDPAAPYNTGVNNRISNNIPTNLLPQFDRNVGSNLLPEFDPLLNGVGRADPARRAFSRLRVLKLNGQIGEQGEEGKLSYSSLSYQIYSAHERGFDDAEICAAVINAITPNLPLRNHLERQRNMTLERLINRLRTHFLLKDATTAFNDMGNMVQKDGVKAVDFCMEVMAMRDDVLALSKEEGGEYTQELVQKQMQHVLSVGFSRASVRIAMRPLLKTANLSDDDIFNALKEIVMSEAEHDAKMESNNITSSVATSTRTPGTAATAATTAAVVSELSFNKTEKLLEDLEQISQTLNELIKLPSEVEQLRKELYQQKQQPGYQQQHQLPYQQQQQPVYATNQLNTSSYLSNAVIANGGNGVANPLVQGNGGNGLGSGGHGVGNGRGRGGNGNFQGEGGNRNGNNGMGRGGRGGGLSGRGRGNTRNGGGGNPPGNNGGGRQVTVTMRKCQNCDQQGPGSYWDHCFYCCGQGHKIQDCPSKNEEGEHL